MTRSAFMSPTTTSKLEDSKKGQNKKEKNAMSKMRRVSRAFRGVYLVDRLGIPNIKDDKQAAANVHSSKTPTMRRSFHRSIKSID